MQNTIQDGGINQLLQRRLNTDAAPAIAVAPEVFPVFPVGQYSSELRYLAGERLCGAAAVAVTGVGLLSGVHLRNPLGSGVLAMVDMWQANTTSGSQLQTFLIPGIADLANVGSSIPLDTRNSLPVATRLTTCVFSTEATAGAPAAARQMGQWLTNNNTCFWPETVVLKPGDGWAMYGVAANLGFHLTLRWRERRAQPSEL